MRSIWASPLRSEESIPHCWVGDSFAPVSYEAWAVQPHILVCGNMELCLSKPIVAHLYSEDKKEMVLGADSCSDNQRTADY